MHLRYGNILFLASIWVHGFWFITTIEFVHLYFAHSLLGMLYFTILECLIGSIGERLQTGRRLVTRLMQLFTQKKSKDLKLCKLG